MVAQKEPKRTRAENAAHSRERAERWSVSVRTMEQLKASFAPVDDDAGMVEWWQSLSSMAQRRLGPMFVRKLRETQSALGNAGKTAGNADYAEFKSRRAEGSSDGDALAHLKRSRDFALYKIDLAQSRNDSVALQDATKEMLHFSAVIDTEERRAQKLGREMGESVTRSSVESFVAAHAYWTMRGTDLALDTLSRKLVNVAFPQDARAILEAELLSIRFVQAYAQAGRVAAKNAFPSWAVVCVRDSVDNFIERGAELFDEASAPVAAEEACSDGGGI